MPDPAHAAEPQPAPALSDTQSVLGPFPSALETVQRLATGIAEVQRQLDAVAAAASEQESRAADPLSREAALAQRSAELSDKARAFDVLEHTLAERELAIIASEQRLTELTGALQEQEVMIERRLRDAAAAEQHIAQLREDASNADRSAREAAQIAEQAARERDEARAQLEPLRQNIAAIESQLHEARQERDAARAELERLRAEHEQQIAQGHEHREALARATHERDRAAAELASSAQQLADACAARDAALAQLDAARAEAAHARAGLEDTQQRQTQVAADAQRLESDRAELAARLEQMEQQAAVAAARAQELSTALERAEAEARDAMGRAAHLAADLARAEEEGRESMARAAHLSADLLRAQTAAQEAAQHAAQHTSTPGGPGTSASSDAWTALRRERLRRQRHLLAERAAQLVQAKDLLQQRLAEVAAAQSSTSGAASDADRAQLDAERAQLQQQMDALARQRAEVEQALAAARQSADAANADRAEIESQRAALQSQRTALEAQRGQIENQRTALETQRLELERQRAARPAAAASFDDEFDPSPARAKAPMPASVRAAVIAASAVMSLAGIAGVSWWAAGVLDVPVYVAASTLTIEEKRGGHSAEALASWQAFQQELLDDPRLMEITAERLDRRGITELRTPTDLRRRLEADLVADTGEAGKVTLTLRGEGGLRTQRTLETLVASMVTMANDARDRRLDGASTAVAQPAATGDAPVASKRQRYFAFIAGGLAALTASLSLAGAAWSRGSRRDNRPAKPVVVPDNKPGPDIGEKAWTIPVE